MTAEELKREIKDQISRLYGELVLRPQLFTRPITVESFVLALEYILDLLDTDARPDGYTKFLGVHSFGMHLFLSAFEMRNSCTLALMEQQGSKEAQASNLESEYIAAFTEHLKEFISWRQSQKPPESVQQ